jgi:hypothetical protein
MATPANIIPVPKPSGKAFNPGRLLSRNTLVEAQVKHFAEADKNLPPELQTGIDINSITTEGQAAAYIRKVTEAIHKSGGRIGKVQRAG